jgi:hypothetical protein
LASGSFASALAEPDLRAEGPRCWCIIRFGLKSFPIPLRKFITNALAALIGIGGLYKLWRIGVSWRWIAVLIAVPLVGAVGTVTYQFLKLRSRIKSFEARKWVRVSPLLDALNSGRGINEDDVAPFARDLATRWTVIEILRDFDLLELFPKELYRFEDIGAGRLAQWLEFPTSLDALPDEIELVERVTLDPDDEGNKTYYHVYRYRIGEPHPAAANGWTLGVVGPYFEESEPHEHPFATFSRKSSRFGETTPNEEARWVHENIFLRDASPETLNG